MPGCVLVVLLSKTKGFQGGDGFMVAGFSGWVFGAFQGVSRRDLECSGSPAGHVLGITWDQKVVQVDSDFIGRLLASVGAERRRVLRDVKWNKFA